MKTIFMILIVGIVYAAYTSDVNTSSTPADTAECVQKGIRYFKGIGSYPQLSDGRYADTVVVQRCNRTSTAF